ncbi:MULTISPECIES: hypothetical protein [Streptomycetaceae]|uniref:hypothetical protein n=1 Tax=unclassified Streptomyces TaxID=2593676 RepID=UPI00338A2C43
MTVTATGPAPMTATVTAARAAGYTHAAAWTVGLAIAWGDTPAAGDTQVRIATAYADQPVQTIAQAVLVHGVAAAGLLVVGSGLLGWARRTGNATARFAGWAGTAAAVLAAVQLVLELIAVSGADPASPGRTAALFEAVQRVDGVKMFTLAALAAAACASSRHGSLLRGWESVTGWALAATITVSGIGYLLPATGLSPAAFLSLPLLLIWIAALGAALARRS